MWFPLALEAMQSGALIGNSCKVQLVFTQENVANSAVLREQRC